MSNKHQRDKKGAEHSWRICVSRHSIRRSPRSSRISVSEHQAHTPEETLAHSSTSYTFPQVSLAVASAASPLRVP